MKNGYFLFITIITSLILTPSCSIERKLAKEFIQRKDSVSVFLLPTDIVFKTNLKTWLIDDYDRLSEKKQAQLLYDSSKYLQFLNDTIFVKRFMSNLQATLRKYGMKTYSSNQLVEFMEIQTLAYQIAWVQCEIEEDIFPYRAQEIFYDSVLFFEDFTLEQVNVNSWFEISKLNDPNAVNNVLFANEYITDGIEGRFTSNIFTGEVKFKYNIYQLKVEDVYTLAANLGEKYAGYIFDYLMNQHIYLEFPKGKHPDSFLSYDHEAETLHPAGDRRFIFMAD